MQTVETIKVKGEATLHQWRAMLNEQPDEVKTWGVAAGGAVVGALAVTAVARGVVALLATLASPPVALTVGAVAGGALAWSYRQSGQATGAAGHPASNSAAGDLPLAEVPIVTADALDAGTVEVDESIPQVVPTPTDTIQPEVPVATAVSTSIEPDVDESIVLEPPQMVAQQTDTPIAQPDVVSPAPVVEEPTPDNLEVISGIGPVYARRLHAAGVHTFAQLADLSVERIHEIIAPVRSSHMIDAERWISAARQLAAQNPPSI